MNIKLIGTLGYLFMSSAYIYYTYLHLNTKSNKLILFGSIVILIGYIVLTFKSYYYEIINNLKNNHKINEKEYEKEKEKSIDINYGYLILTIFFSLGFIIKINEHTKISDIIAIIGNGLCINKKDYNIYGYMFLIAYYANYIFRHYTSAEYDDKVKNVGSLFLIIYYFMSIKNFKKHTIKNI